jgi:hypothetical protein
VRVGTVNDAEFQSLLEQVRELHELADELAESTWIRANVRARLSWEPDPPPLPPPERELADKVVEVLERPELSSWQARQLRHIFFDR